MGGGLQPVGHPLAPRTPVGQAGPWSRQRRRTISYLDNSTCPGSVSAREWTAWSFPVRVKAPGRLMAVKGAGQKETARGQEGGDGCPHCFIPILLLTPEPGPGARQAQGPQQQGTGPRKGRHPIPASCPPLSCEMPAAQGGYARLAGWLKSWGSSGKGRPGRRGSHGMQLASLTGMS